MLSGEDILNRVYVIHLITPFSPLSLTPILVFLSSLFSCPLETKIPKSFKTHVKLASSSSSLPLHAHGRPRGRPRHRHSHKLKLFAAAIATRTSKSCLRQPSPLAQAKAVCGSPSFVIVSQGQDRGSINPLSQGTVSFLLIHCLLDSPYRAPRRDS